MFGLETIAPRFLVPSKRINVLHDPSEFYTYLCSRIRTAQSRVFLASLYLGKSEQELVDVIASALHNNSNLRVYVLVDGLRGTREAPRQCSASLLAPLAAQYPSRVRLSMYRTPKLGFLTSKLLPKRIIEGVGLQHMKLYGFDDEIVLSGANLSQDYFTNRQDRYISIKDGQLTDYFYNIHSAVSDLSYNLLPADNEQEFTLTPPSRQNCQAARQNLASLLKPSASGKVLDLQKDGNSNMTEVYPLAEFAPLTLGNEHDAMQRVITEAQKPENGWMLTAGYFNVEPKLAKALANATDGEIVVASPEANGFYKSKGISGKLPHYYSLLTRKFLDQVPESNIISIREWQRGVVNTPGGWSYHAKGIWLWKKNDPLKLPFLTYIGSSNFTRRGYRYDLECGAVLIANDSKEKDTLMTQLSEEKGRIEMHCVRQLSEKIFRPRATVIDRVLLAVLGNRL